MAWVTGARDVLLQRTGPFSGLAAAGRGGLPNGFSCCCRAFLRDELAECESSCPMCLMNGMIRNESGMKALCFFVH